MKKLIIISLLLVFILAIAVHSAIYIISDSQLIQENADQTRNDTIGTNGSSPHNDSAFTDGDYDTYALSNGTFYMNYTKTADYSSLSLWQVKYNSSGGADTTNYSLSSDCWDQDSTKVILKVNATGTSNAQYCYSGTWDLLVSIKNQQALYEESMWWYVIGRNYSISHNLVKPAAYVTFDNALVNFSLNINDTNADINHSTFNASLYTRMNDTAAYTLNVSGIVITNNTAHNGTTVNFADGDRVWWKWVVEDNYSRTIFNTSVRVFDVDLVYYTLSLGANKVINLSLDSGEIVTKGGLTAANYTAGSSAGLTIQLNLTGCNVTLTGGLFTAYTGANCDVS